MCELYVILFLPVAMAIWYWYEFHKKSPS